MGKFLRLHERKDDESLNQTIDKQILTLLGSKSENFLFWSLYLLQFWKDNLSRLARKPTLWALSKVSTRISLSMPCRLTRIDTFWLLWIFCFRNHYSIPLSAGDGMCRPRSVCADCAGWSDSIHCAEAIMLVFSRDSSCNFKVNTLSWILII